LETSPAALVTRGSEVEQATIPVVIVAVKQPSTTARGNIYARVVEG